MLMLFEGSLYGQEDMCVLDTRQWKCDLLSNLIQFHLGESWA